MALLIEKLELLKKDIELLSKEHHVHILKLLKNNNVNINENKNGVFLNLTELSEIVIDELQNYCLYIKNQEVKLNDMQESQDKIEKELF